MYPQARQVKKKRKKKKKKKKKRQYESVRED